MSGITTDPESPDISRGPPDESAVPQSDKYLVLSEEERAKGYVQWLRTQYSHKACATATTMNQSIAETYARDPWFYTATYCVKCSMHRPLSEFQWEPDGQEMDPNKWTDEQLEAVVARKAELEL